MTVNEYVNPFPEPEHRVRQAAPDDLVQQQFRLLVLALRDLSDAISATDRKHLHGDHSVGSQTEAAAAALNEIAGLGGWTESLMPYDVPVTSGETTTIYHRTEDDLPR